MKSWKIWIWTSSRRTIGWSDNLWTFLVLSKGSAKRFGWERLFFRMLSIRMPLITWINLFKRTFQRVLDLFATNLVEKICKHFNVSTSLKVLKFHLNARQRVCNAVNKWANEQKELPLSSIIVDPFSKQFEVGASHWELTTELLYEEAHHRQLNSMHRSWSQKTGLYDHRALHH